MAARWAHRSRSARPLTNPQLTTLIGTAAAQGMPPNVINATETASLVRYLRELERRAADKPVVRMTVQTTDGRTLEGQVLGEASTICSCAPTIDRCTSCGARGNGSGR